MLRALLDSLRLAYNSDVAGIDLCSCPVAAGERATETVFVELGLAEDRLRQTCIWLFSGLLLVCLTWRQADGSRGY